MKHLLITGNAASLASAICQRLCRGYQVTVAASFVPETVPGNGITVLPLSSKRPLNSVFGASPYDAMVFLATRGEQETSLLGEADLLSSALALAHRHRVGRVLYLSSGELNFPETALGERGLKMEAMERLCAAYRQMGLPVTVLRLPLVFGPGEDDTLTGRMLLSALRGGAAEIPFPADAQADFLSAAEAALLAEKLLDSQTPPDALYTVRGGETLTGGELKALLELMGISATLSAEKPGCPPMDGEKLARELGFAPLNRLSVELDRLHASYKALYQKLQAEKAPVRSFFGRHPLLTRGASLLLGYAGLEALTGLQGAGLFPALDVRLLYVALVSAAHGLQTGLIAILLACFSLARSFGAQGMTLNTLVQDWRPWMPIAALILTGIAAGLARDRGGREAKKTREEARELARRCAYLQDLYRQSLLAKQPPAPPPGNGLEQQLNSLREGQERLEREWLSLIAGTQGGAEDAYEPAEAPPAPLPSTVEPAETPDPGQPVQTPEDADSQEPFEEDTGSAPEVSFSKDIAPEKVPEQTPPAASDTQPEATAGEPYQHPRKETGEARDRFGAVKASGSPFLSMTPSERRRMLEAMQVRAGKPGKRKRDR